MTESSLESKLLCVNCRCSGHLRRDCKIPWPGAAAFQRWAHSSHRAETISQLLENSSGDTCQRCKELEILKMFEGKPWWKAPGRLYLWEIEKNQHYRNLGSVATTEFRNDCPLCICLFSLAPNPYSSEGDFHIIADWTIHRVERLAHVEPQRRGNYDICILVQASTTTDTIDLSEHLGDALCLMRDKEERKTHPLAVQLVQREEFIIGLIQRYISKCLQLHPYTCSSRTSDDLKAIKLIDVRARKVVPYPGGSCEYIALSYVWGDVDAFQFIQNDLLECVPKTIEDAMALTVMLGKSYLWVDLFCVDQHDEAERRRQIKLMSSIYNGAFASIVAMSGTTMESGLARMSRSSKDRQSQLTCNVDGRQLVGLMPTLSQQIHSCTWGTRSWTLQEALLSPRCIYITDHQVYFECNAMQCCESLDESSSWIHQSVRDRKAIKADPLGSVHGHGTLRKTYEGDGRPKDYLEIYFTLTALYSIRHMTDLNDVIFAYSGILQHLTNLAYPKGFFWAHPISDFDWSLLWWHSNDFSRRPGKFPAWSWTGWHGQVFPSYPADGHSSRKFSTYLRAWGVMNGQVCELYNSLRQQAERRSQNAIDNNSDTTQTSKPRHRLFKKDTSFDRISDMPLINPAEITDLRQAEEDGHIVLESALCSFTVTHLQQSTYFSNPPAEFYDVEIGPNNVPCILRATPGDFDCQQGSSIILKNLALIARDKGSGYIYHYFLQLYFDNQQCTRGSRTGRVYELMVPKDRPDAVDAIHLERRQIVML